MNSRERASRTDRMLPKQVTQAIQEAASRYPAPRNACIEALSLVKEEQGWVSSEAIDEIAVLLEMPAPEVDAVASFYNLIFLQPVGRHVIFICDSVSCWILKYQRIVEHLGRTLDIGFGETTPDGRFTLLPIQCLGACDHAPAMIVDGDLHGDLTPEKVDQILEGYE